MEKFYLPNACYDKKVSKAVIKKREYSAEHQILVDEANLRIEKKRRNYAMAYEKASTYLSD